MARLQLLGENEGTRKAKSRIPKLQRRERRAREGRVEVVVVKVKVTNDKLYVLEIGDEKAVFDTKDEVVRELEENDDPTTIKVSEIHMSGETNEWMVKGIDWRDLFFRQVRQSREGE